MLMPLEKPSSSVRFAQPDARLLQIYKYERYAVLQTELSVRQILPLWQQLSQHFLKDNIFYAANDSSECRAAEKFGRTLQDVYQTVRSALKYCDDILKVIQNGGSVLEPSSQARQAFVNMSKLVDVNKIANALHDYVIALEDEGDYNRDYVRRLSVLEDNIRSLENYKKYYWDFNDSYR